MVPPQPGLMNADACFRPLRLCDLLEKTLCQNADLAFDVSVLHRSHMSSHSTMM
jgi:hypothetical protein